MLLKIETIARTKSPLKVKELGGIQETLELDVVVVRVIKDVG